MSCFKEGANHTGQGPGRGGRRSRRKGEREMRAAAQALFSGASGIESARSKLAGLSGCSLENPAPKPSKSVKRLQSLERTFKDPPTDNRDLPMKIGKLNYLLATSKTILLS